MVKRKVRDVMAGSGTKRKDRTVGMTRRELLRGAGVSAAVGASTLGAVTSYAKTTQQSENVAEAAEAYEQLTAEEGQLLEAIADHLIPSDDTGPGALDANAVRYIDRALGGALSDSLDAYRAGLAAFQRYCRSSRGGDFMELPRNDRISALIDVETGAATGAGAGFVGSSAAFFSMIRGHVLQGTFGDPYYGGNENFIGWDLIGYPGVRTAVTENDQQRLEAGELRPYRRSAYGWEEFDKATVRAARKGLRHAD